jgi:hypothetical protein
LSVIFRCVSRRRHRWEVDVKVSLEDMGYEIVDWIHVIQGRGLWSTFLEYENEYSGSIKPASVSWLTRPLCVTQGATYIYVLIY